MNVKVRVWWPKELCNSNPPSSTTTYLLFGWFISNSSSSSLDLVVSFAFPHHFLSLHSSDFAIQEAIHHANERMPVILQEKVSLTVLGRYVMRHKTMDPMENANMVDLHNSEHNKASLLNGQHTSLEHHGTSSLDFDGLLNQDEHSSICSSTWIQLVCNECDYFSNGISWIPTLDHLHWNGKLLSQAELHVMIYETPRFGIHHFTINSFSSKLTKCSLRRPKWVDELSHKQRLVDLDTVILAINCSASVYVLFSKYLGLQSSSRKSASYMFLFIWRIWAIIVATFSTSLYIILQLFNKLVRWGSNFGVCTTLAKLFSNMWRCIQARCHQILFWPFFLGEMDLRSQACVEYAEKSRLRRHSLWTSAIMDVLLGNLLGFPLLFHSELILNWLSCFSLHIIDDVLRSGCVWLMGVPAGFKLNTELAEVFGILSLNAIQIWCTLWFSIAHIFPYVIKIIAFSGIFLGLTFLVALISDMIAIGALLVYALHYVISLVYSLQIQSLTALWRLFRGRKWNPLRKRLDSYEYNVEQHVVGSLLFTPLLLLLPTTSIFYIFFAIINVTILFTLTLIEIFISIVHDTPYSKILLWLVRPKRFPSGIWFEIIHCESDDSLVGSSPPCKKSAHLVSLLASNILTFGQVVLPHYKNFLCGVHGLTLRSTMSGILTGKSLLSTHPSNISSKMPWISIPFRDYWYICYNAVLPCFEQI